MRIAMIGQKSIPAEYGGVEKAVEEVAAELVRRGHEVTAFCQRPEGLHRPKFHRGIRLRYVHTVGGKHMTNATQSLLASIASVIDDFDIVHYHAMGPTLFSVLPKLSGRAKVVVTIQGRDDKRAKWSKPAQFVLGTAAKACAYVPHQRIAVSGQLKDDFANEFGRSTTHIPNGVCPIGDAPEYTSDELPEAFGLSEHRYLVNVGRLVPEKGVDLLLKAFQQVPTDMGLAIVGGSSHTDGYVDELKALAAQDDRVVLTGPVYGNGCDSLFRHAAGYVMPSLLEGLPLALLESISYGLPVAVSDIPPHTEVVHQDGPGHRVFRAGDIEDMAKQLTQFVQNLPAEYTAAEALRSRVMVEYGWQGITDKTEAVYRAALSGTETLVDMGTFPTPGSAAQAA